MFAFAFLSEIISVGITVILIGFLCAYSLVIILDDKQAKIKLDSSIGQLTVLFFVTGVATHMIFEISGLNKWYCKNGYACQ